MIEQSKWVMMHLLKCGLCDLSMLDKIEYDLEDILDELTENNSLSLENIVIQAVLKGVDELEELVNFYKPDVIEDLQILDECLPKKTDSADIITQKADALDANAIYLSNKYDIEYGDLIPKYIEMLSEINPSDDVRFYFNFLCSNIYFENHGDIYRRFFSDQISEIERKIGFYFSNY